MIVTSEKVIPQAKASRYAVPCFIVYNLETLLGVLRAAQKQHSPVIIGVSESTLEYAGTETAAGMVIRAAEEWAGDVPVVLHLDHGKSLEAVKRCISAGFSSVQIDGSRLPLDENVSLTQAVVQYAHQHDIWVEGELGEIHGGHGQVGDKFQGEIPLVKPEEVADFFERTGVDMLATALGTVHGKFKNEHIHFDLLERVSGVTDVGLVLHGASGLPDGEIAQAVAAGIVKVNIGTETKQLFVSSIRETLSHEDAPAGPRELLTPTVEAIMAMAENRIKLLGSANRA
ncbi:MAG: class II fructose-bisphosphate aldolase [bacterium]|nr:class II fructose-bisphosphate aldolase [bacterium]